MNAYMRGLTERGIDKDLSTGFLFVAVTANSKQAAERYLDARFERVEEGYWRLPAPKLQDVPLTFVKTTTSGRATEEVITQRRLACFGDESTPACPALVKGEFCGECRCPQLPWASMKGWKIERAYLECPRGKAGFSNEVTSG